MFGYPVLRSKPQRWIPELQFGYPPQKFFGIVLGETRNFSRKFWASQRQLCRKPGRYYINYPTTQKYEGFSKPHQHQKKNQKNPKIPCISPKVNVISPRVNLISPKVNVKYFRASWKNLKFFETSCWGSWSQGSQKYLTQNDYRTELHYSRIIFSKSCFLIA